MEQIRSANVWKAVKELERERKREREKGERKERRERKLHIFKMAIFFSSLFFAVFLYHKDFSSSSSYEERNYTTRKIFVASSSSPLTVKEIMLFVPFLCFPFNVSSRRVCAKNEGGEEKKIRRFRMMFYTKIFISLLSLFAHSLPLDVHCFFFFFRRFSFFFY